MVAEAWARRKYQAALENKINEALGEAMETQAWIDHDYDCNYISLIQHREMDDAWQMIGGMTK
jgi:four helix bundle protein